MRGLPSLLGLAAGLVVAAPATAADQTITFPNGSSPNYSYSPTPATIKTGDTATFSGSFTSHPLVWNNGEFATTDAGTSKAFSFSQPGTYNYHCMIHSGPPWNMVGTLSVIADQHPASASRSASAPRRRAPARP